MAMARASCAASCGFMAAAATLLPAQAPGWSSEEASVPAVLAALTQGPEKEFFQRLKSAPLPVIEMVPSRTSPPGMSMRLAGTGYRFRAHWGGHGEAAGDGWLLYAWPDKFGGDCSKAFALSSRGTVMWTDNLTARYGDGVEPEWTAMLAGGGKESFADALSQPGKGADGQVWRTLAMERPCKASVRVRTPAATGVWVRLGPPAWFRRDSTAVPVAFPAGIVRTDGDGRAEWEGLPRSDYRVTLLLGPAPEPRLGDMEISPRVQFRDGALELTVDDSMLLAARAHAYESVAIATLKNISSSQAQCQASAVIDTDGDGTGEFGFFGELSGARAVRRDQAGAVSDKLITPPVLSTVFGRVEESRVQRSGYLFQIFLRDRKGNWVAENKDGGGAGVNVDANAAEQHWCCYAWPVDAGKSGRRAFFIDESHQVLAMDNAAGRYSGAAKPVSPDAAFAGAKCDKIAANAPGNDSERWIVVN
jgi:hypothetical protein